jgi:acetylornithine deacetylase
MESAIYVHPHESGGGLNQIHMTSVGQVEFLIEVEVKPSDTTDHFKAVYSKSNVSAAKKGVYLFRGLHEWAEEASKRYRHSGMEKELGGHAFALMVARFVAGAEKSDRHSLDGLARVEAYSIPIRCVLQGTVMFPPNASQETVQAEFKEALERLVKKDPELAQSKVRLEWGDLIGDSAQADEESELLRTVFRVLTDVTGEEAYCYYGHTLSDTRCPMLYWNAQAVGVGPHCGDIGTQSEWIDRKQYLDTIVAVTQMIRQLA